MLSALPSSNPELRISVLNPLRHMGPSGIPGSCSSVSAKAMVSEGTWHACTLAGTHTNKHTQLPLPPNPVNNTPHVGLEEAYISYEVVTCTSLPTFSGQRFSVRRRFRDVVSLANLMPKLLHGR